MKKLIITATAVLGLGLLSTNSFAQLRDEKNVTITMDLQPILQLDMTTPDQIDFVFNNISDYYGGIIKYGGTILKVSASVNWDLWAVGTSLAHMTASTNAWDVQAFYGTGFDNATNGTRTIPLTALELKQSPDNFAETGFTGTYGDYFLPFAAVTFASVPAAAAIGQNSIYVSAAGTDVFLPPGTGEKYIQGHSGSGNYIQGGSYLTNSLTPLAGDNTGGAAAAGTTGQTQTGQNSNINAFYNVIDYRIVPGLPAVFPAAGDNAAATHALVNPAYAQPGYYTMNVKYILSENQ